MELLVIATVLSFANIFGTQAVTNQMPQFVGQEYPQPVQQQVSMRHADEPKSLFEAVEKFKKEKGLI